MFENNKIYFILFFISPLLSFSYFFKSLLEKKKSDMYFRKISFNIFFLEL